MAYAFAGPRLFAVPGDILNIVFRNNLNYTVNIVPSGAVTNSTEVAEAGQTITYQWSVGNDVSMHSLLSSSLCHWEVGMLGTPLMVLRGSGGTDREEFWHVMGTNHAPYRVWRHTATIPGNLEDTFHATPWYRGIAIGCEISPRHAALQALPSKKETATSQLWLYRSTVDFEGDANAGLVGPLIVTNPAYALPSKQPSDVAQTFVALFQVKAFGAAPVLLNTLVTPCWDLIPPTPWCPSWLTIPVSDASRVSLSIWDWAEDMGVVFADHQ